MKCLLRSQCSVWELHLGKHDGRALDEQSRTLLNKQQSDQSRTVLVALFSSLAHDLFLSLDLTIEGASIQFFSCFKGDLSTRIALFECA